MSKEFNIRVRVGEYAAETELPPERFKAHVTHESCASGPFDRVRIDWWSEHCEGFGSGPQHVHLLPEAALALLEALEAWAKGEHMRDEPAEDKP